ncbi:bifunctional DNA primase/polymerase [Prosthecomicrobium sp. N25]|uniref:bifunctional DNA primase/polymerase n=1 Tax=Prosthecomicrobium sp. N25 TaxID=3129254 RepID=UPI003077D019
MRKQLIAGVNEFRRRAYENGFQPIPVRTGEKVPARPGWQYTDGVIPATITTTNTGILCRGLRAVDIDVDDPEHVTEVVGILREVAGLSIARVRGDSPRALFVFTAPPGEAPAKRIIKLGAVGKVGILGDGQQFVAHGVHPDGAPFEWPSGSPATVTRDELPILDELAEDELETRLLAKFNVGQAPTPAPSPPARSSLPLPAGRDEKRIDSYLSNAIEGEAEAVRSAPKGGRNNQLNASAVKLGHYVAGGHLPESHVVAVLSAAAASAGLDPVETAKTIRSGLAAGMRTPKDPPLPAADIDPEFVAVVDKLQALFSAQLFDEDTGEVADIGEDLPAEAWTTAPPLAGRYEVPDELTRPPGLVGRLVDWITDSNRFPCRALALGAALTIVGTVAGRQCGTPTGAGTHLYVLALAPTGVGKNHPAQCIARAMDSALLGHLLGPDDFASGTALYKVLADTPLALCTMDEFGVFLARINNKRAGGHEQAMSGVLRKAWGNSFARMTTPSYASIQAQTIYGPALSIYATSTPEEFYRSLASADVHNGLLNRFLLLSTEQKARPVKPAIGGDVPDDIRDGLARLFYASGEMSASGIHKGPCKAPARVVQWGTDAEAMFEAFAEEVATIIDEDTGTGAFFARTAEMAVRIATIVALGRDPHAFVTVEDMQFGIEVARWSAEAMRTQALEHMAESEAQALALRILRIVRKAGGEITRAGLLRALNHVARKRDINDAMDGLREAGQIAQVADRTPGAKGRTPVVYKLLR